SGVRFMTTLGSQCSDKISAHSIGLYAHRHRHRPHPTRTREVDRLAGGERVAGCATCAVGTRCAGLGAQILDRVRQALRLWVTREAVGHTPAEALTARGAVAARVACAHPTLNAEAEARLTGRTTGGAHVARAHG